MLNREKFVYKILTINEWEDFKNFFFFYGTELDKSSKFIHLSSLSQLSETISLYFLEYNKVVILELETISIKEGLKWELSRNNEFFPHYHGTLDIKLICRKFVVNPKKYNNLTICSDE